MGIFSFNFKANALSEHVQEVINAVNQVNTAHPDWWWARVSIDWSNVSVTCVNWVNLWTVSLTPEETNQVVAIVGTVSTVTVTTPPPVPVVTNSSSTSWWCSQYISSWTTTWSECGISWSWNPNWQINCTQTASHSPNYSSCWNMTCTTTYVDGVDSWTSCWPCEWCPWDASQPSDPPIVKTITASLSSTTSTCDWSLYANNQDSCKVTLNFSSPTNQWRWITSWWTNWTISNMTDLSGEKSDRINNNGTALNFSSISTSNISNSTWNNFNIDISGIKSTTPFKSSSWKIWLNLWWTQVVINNVDYNFKKPFAWNIQTWDNTTNTWAGTPRIWTLWQYKLSLVQKSTITPSSLNSYSLDNFTSKIEPIWNGVSVQSNNITTTTISDTSWTTFNARLNTTAWASSLNQTPWLQVNNPIIKYSLWWQNVSYYLTESDGAQDSTPIKTTWWNFMSIKVEGSAQSSWKGTITWQAESNSNLYPNNMRTPLRKNAYSYIKSMRSGDIMDWVKYVEGDINISWDQPYETLVVKDGNVIITWNLNPTNKTLWIIVLKDAYNLNDWFSKKWNVYIKPNVTKINAVIYADWGIISVNSSWVTYSWDSIDRTNDLNKQLVLNWSFFTRNTIWWAILAWWDYILPGWWTTSDFDLAMQYDLNYLRRWNSICDSNGNNCTSWWTAAPVIIKYNSKVQTNPPKLFSF
jgi:hypothetical protein